MSTGDRLIYMANQIACNFGAEKGERAAALVEEHMLLFWDPAMRARVISIASASPCKLSPAAAAAIKRIAAR